MPTDPIGTAGIPAQKPQPRAETSSQAAEAAKSTRPEREQAPSDTSSTTSSASSEKLQISPKARELLELKDLMSAARKSLDEPHFAPTHAMTMQLRHRHLLLVKSKWYD